MKLTLLPALAVLTVTGWGSAALAENLEHVQQLIETKQCSQCELSQAGLVYASLSGANLQNANLVQANLSRSNLSGANLQGANLAGAALVNANLSGADLSGADLRNADLRGAILNGAMIQGANLDGANVLQAVGLPAMIATPENLYRFGLAEAQRGNFRGAISNYDQALTRNPTFAHAYLARAMARMRLSDDAGAIGDAQSAQELYTTQGDSQGQELSAQFITSVQAYQEAEQQRLKAANGQGGGGGGNFFSFLGSVAGLALQIFLQGSMGGLGL
ncbi:pentapeptide repeat-containing protein [Leptolyngbya sp. FACHB-711]|uniref:pentapeptide repeat-containing protein n=1 Tax=unclassified Leptolyngbya TaxID=2650499 RepID=UPI0016827325|nr:pentapeptide repeat-containing protein [Leptolyngbya sp. FACHB-711]MBD1850353.1 pentapeptide repeat-containing protein [Cyanobacteria bacterium FACHB-502]MBD2023664.1 pentapeptide repeat-containing protein [Leptolyngbya sp. FACHB-711]